jgi:ketosteroid isomerase-like protein
MRRIILICVAIFIMCLSLSAQTNKDEQALMQLEHDWAAAYLKHDTETIARILADDYVGIDGRGIVTDKAGEIEDAKAPGADEPPSDFIILDDQITDMKVRLYGKVAVVNGISVEKVKIKDKESIVRFRRTTVWEKRKGRWQCVSFHGSRILEQPPQNMPPVDPIPKS